MDDKKLLPWLKRLAQLDVDAVATYDAAIRRVTDDDVKEKLAGFRVDHLRHIDDLNALIQKMGGERIEQEIDLKGRALEGFTALSSMAGTDGALAAMVGNEELTNLTYEVATRLSGNDEAMAVIRKNREDERRHLAWILATLKSRVLKGRRPDAEANA